MIIIPEDVKKRFIATGFEVIEVEDGNNVDALAKAIKKAKRNLYKPTLIINHTIIGFGSINQGTSKVHGSPLGKEDGKNAKLSYGFDHEEFYVPEEVYQHFNQTILKRGKNKNKKWDKLLKQYQELYPELHKEFMQALVMITNLILIKFSLNITPVILMLLVILHNK